MARNNQGSNQNYLQRAPIFTAAPFSIAAWVLSTDGTNTKDQFVWTVRNTSNTGYWRFGFRTNGQMRYDIYDGSSTTPVNAVGTFTANKWYRVLCVEGSATDHRIYINGANKAQSVASRIPLNANQFVMCGFPGSQVLSGLVGPFTVWNGYALSDQEARDEYLGAYIGAKYRLDYDMETRNNGGEIDSTRKFPFTVTGTLLTENSNNVPPSFRRKVSRASSTKSKPVYGLYVPPGSGITKTDIIKWSNDQGTAITPPPPPPPPPTTQQIFWGDSRIEHQESADRLFSAHNANITMVGGSSVNQSQFKNISESTGLVDGTGRVVLKKVSADPANEGINRNWFLIQICNNSERYNPSNPNDNSIRINSGGPYSTIIQPGVDWWYMESFVFDPSLYVDMGAPTVCDTSLCGLHQASGTSNTLTPFTLMADPPNSAGITLKWRIRRWNPAGTLNPSGTALSTDKIILASAVGNKRYTLITHFRLGWLASHDPIHEAFLQVNGAWQNNGNAIYTYDGSYSGLTDRAVGYNINPYSHQTRTFALYNWLCETQFNVGGATHPDAWPKSANNIPNTGDRGWRAWYRCGFAIKGIASLVGEAPVNQYTLAALANAASI